MTPALLSLLALALAPVPDRRFPSPDLSGAYECMGYPLTFDRVTRIAYVVTWGRPDELSTVRGTLCEVERGVYAVTLPNYAGGPPQAWRWRLEGDRLIPVPDDTLHTRPMVRLSTRRAEQLREPPRRVD